MKLHPNVVNEINAMTDDEMRALLLYLEEQERMDADRAKQAEMLRYQVDYRAYCRDKLGVTLTDDQCRIFDSVRDNRYTLVKASHAAGKSFGAACLLNHWYDCWDQHIGYVTAPTWNQAMGLTFKTAAKMRRENGLPGKIVDGTGLVRDEDPIRAVGHYFKALNAESGEGFQGEHSSDILVVIEEGVGVPPYIWEAMRGLMTSPGCRALSIGNPTNEASPFGEAASRPEWEVFSISALDHPNVLAELRGQPQPFPKAVGLLWLYEMLGAECEPSPTPEEDAFLYWKRDLLKAVLDGNASIPDADRFASLAGDERLCWYRPTAEFQGRVLGEFPSVPDSQVIPSGWLRNLPIIADEALAGVMPEIGCDVARHGTDRTVVATDRGGAALDLQIVRRMDNVAVADKCVFAAIVASLSSGADPKDVPMKIDVTGHSGTGVYDILKSRGYNAVECNVSTRAYDEKSYPNRRSELWFIAREAFRTRRVDLSRLAPDKHRGLVKELAVPSWKLDNAGRKVVEKKDEIKKRLGYSPDLADAFNMAITPTLMLGGRIRPLNPSLLDPAAPIEKVEAERIAVERDAMARLPADVRDHVLGLIGR